MAYITVNQIIDVFRDIADRHLMINDFGNGPTYNIGAADELKFPYLWVENGDINTVFSANGMREKRLTFNLYLMDKINKGDDNFDEIISDTEFILSGIIQEFSQLPFYVQNKLSLFQDINLTPVVEATDDNVNGWQATISLKIPIPYTYCEMPIRPYVEPSIPSQPCLFEPISIQNSLGCEFIEITEYPTGGISILPPVNLNSTTVQHFKNITINNESIASVNQIDDCSIEIDLQSKFPILLTNGTCLIDTITGSTAGGSVHILPTIEIFDGLVDLGDYVIPQKINITTDCGVDSITTSNNSCDLNLNIGSCFPIDLVNRYGCFIDKINTNPNGSFQLPTTTFTDDNGVFGTEFIGTSINIIGASISAITTSNSGCDTNIIIEESQPSCLPISINNSEGCELATITECPTACTGYTWNITIGEGGSLTNLNLLDCNGEVYDIIPFLGPGTYSFCHSSTIVPTGVVNLPVTFTNTFEICTITYDYELPDINITDSDAFSASTASPNNIIVNGASVSSVVTSGCNLTINIEQLGGINYQRPHWSGQITSYVIGDAGWQAANGTYNWVTTGNTSQVLDFSSIDPFYTLVNLNEFGNYNRFTTDDGTPASDNKALFISTDFSSSTENYVIDHLTGLGWIIGKIGFQQLWETAVTASTSYSLGSYSDFRMPSIEEIESVIKITVEYYNNSNLGNIFNRTLITAGNDTTLWLSNTDEQVSINNSFKLFAAGDIRRQPKTSTTLCGTYVCRTHY